MGSNPPAVLPAVQDDGNGTTVTACDEGAGDLAIVNDPAVGELEASQQPNRSVDGGGAFTDHNNAAPKPKRAYNLSGLNKRKRKFCRNLKTHQKQSATNFMAIREEMGQPNANAQTMSCYLHPTQEPGHCRPSPPQKVRKQRDYYRGALKRLQNSFKKRGERIKRLEAEKQGLLNRIKAEKKASEEYTDSITRDVDTVYSNA